MTLVLIPGFLRSMPAAVWIIGANLAGLVGLYQSLNLAGDLRTDSRLSSQFASICVAHWFVGLMYFSACLNH